MVKTGIAVRIGFLVLGLALGQVLAHADSSYYVSHMATARAYYKDRNYSAALGSLKAAQNLEPERFESYELHAKILFDQANPVEAHRIATIALEKAPKDKRGPIETLIAQIDEKMPRAVPKFQGTSFFNSWEVYKIDGNPDALLVRDSAVTKKLLAIQAMEKSFIAFRQFAMLPRGEWYLPLGEQPEMELIADQACTFVKLHTADVVSIGKAEIEMEFKINTEVKRLEAIPPQDYKNLDSFATNLRDPIEDRIMVAATVFSCKDPSTKRIRHAQQRAAMKFIDTWQKILVKLLLNKKNDAAQSTTEADKGSRSALYHRSREILTKSIQNQGAQIRAFQIYLQNRDAGHFYTLSQIEVLKVNARRMEQNYIKQISKLGRQKSLTVYLDQKDYQFMKYLFPTGNP